MNCTEEVRVVAKREGEVGARPTPARPKSAPYIERYPSWFERNWDKILMATLSVVVSGVIGFFAAIKTIDSELSSVRQELAALKTENAGNIREVDHLRAQLSQVSSLESRITRVEVQSGYVISQFDYIWVHLKLPQ